MQPESWHAFQLEEGVRTVRWNARWDKPPEVIKYGVNDRDSIGCTAMHWAALNDRVSLMRLLQQEGADLSVPGNEGCAAQRCSPLPGHACRDFWNFGDSNSSPSFEGV
jgi:ankyrin repeat protein